MNQEIARKQVMDATQKLMADYDAANGGIAAGMTRTQTQNYAVKRMAYINDHIFDVINTDAAQAAI